MLAEFGFNIKYFAALLAIMNPLTVVPVFLAMTANESQAGKSKMALTAALTVLILLLVPALSGGSLLNFFGVSIDAFRTSGGIIILLMALSMLHAQPSKISSTEEEKEEGIQKDNPAIFPIAIPLLAGPGAISTVIIYSTKESNFAASAIVISAMSIIIFITLFLAAKLGKFLGTTGMNIITRLMGMLLAAIGVEMIVDGGASLILSALK